MKLLITTAGAIVMWTLGSVTAAASCVGPPPPIASVVSTAPVVFIGTVEQTEDGGRTAVVRVESVWRGPTLPVRVVVHGSREPAAAATSVDRHYSQGVRYLFVPVNVLPPFEDNACTSTHPMTDAIGRLAPTDARSPDPTSKVSDDGIGPAIWILVAAGVAVAVGSGSAMYWKRRRRAVNATISRKTPSPRT